MTNQSKSFQFLGLNLVVIGIVLLTGAVLRTSAQSRDPFKKPGYAIQRNTSPSSGGRLERLSFDTGCAQPAVDRAAHRLLQANA